MYEIVDLFSKNTRPFDKLFAKTVEIFDQFVTFSSKIASGPF